MIFDSVKSAEPPPMLEQYVKKILTSRVYDVAVIGVPDDDLGEVAKACVQLAPEYTPSDELAAELLDFVHESLAPYKSPRTVDFVDELPRTPTGKLVKGQLRKAYWPSTV